MPNDNDSTTGAGSLLTFLFGIAVGVAGTLIYAAINEDRFQVAVGKTKSLTGPVKNSVDDYLDETHDKINGMRVKAKGALESTVAKVKGKATSGLESVQDSIDDLKGELNS